MKKPIQIEDALIVDLLMYLDDQVIQNEFTRFCGESLAGVPAVAYCEGYCQTCGIPVDRHIAMDLIRAFNIARSQADKDQEPKPRKARKLRAVVTSPVVN